MKTDMRKSSTTHLIVFCFVAITPFLSSPSVTAGNQNGTEIVGAAGMTAGQTPPAPDWGPLKNWETEVMGVRVKGNAQRRNNEIRGVLHIYPPLSHRWTYHWNGRIDGDSVVASHTDGHVFRGSITPEKTVLGTLTTKDGHKIPLQAPLPQNR